LSQALLLLRKRHAIDGCRLVVAEKAAVIEVGRARRRRYLAV
jgi:hypothetical protein